MDVRATRREIVAAALAAGTMPMLPRWAAAQGIELGPAAPFSFDELRDMARVLAEEPFVPATVADAEILQAIDYDLHNQITFRPDSTLWGDVPGAAKVRFFYPGRYFQEPVRISVVENGEAREIIFSNELFDMPDDHPARAVQEAGFAGFRVMDPEAKDDWLAVLGASYFRTSGYANQFGLSARGLAIDSGGPGPEEFPRFTRFWLEQAAEGGLVIYALLESPRATGAYRLDTARRPGEGIFQDIEANVFLRGEVARLGIAPLTSMFWYGKNNHFVGPDWRPEIHDSDGLEMQLANGEHIWRPLNNPPRVMANSFAAEGLRGFGLAQRERSFEEYQDDGVFYEKRATAWIEPQGDWGAGSVMLVELPTNDEIHDNIVAFWNPARAGGQRRELRPPLQAELGRELAARCRWRASSPPASAPAACRASRGRRTW